MDTHIINILVGSSWCCEEREKGNSSDKTGRGDLGSGRGSQVETLLPLGCLTMPGDTFCCHHREGAAGRGQVEARDAGYPTEGSQESPPQHGMIWPKMSLVLTLRSP